MANYETPHISRAAVKRFILSASDAKRVSSLTYKEVDMLIAREAERLLEAASYYSQTAGRKRVNSRDVQAAIRALDGVSYAGADGLKKVITKRG
jgi:histone H3/H4